MLHIEAEKKKKKVLSPLILQEAGVYYYTGQSQNKSHFMSLK